MIWVLIIICIFLFCLVLGSEGATEALGGVVGCLISLVFIALVLGGIGFIIFFVMMVAS